MSDTENRELGHIIDEVVEIFYQRNRAKFELKEDGSKADWRQVQRLLFIRDFLNEADPELAVARLKEVNALPEIVRKVQSLEEKVAHLTQMQADLEKLDNYTGFACARRTLGRMKNGIQIEVWLSDRQPTDDSKAQFEPVNIRDGNTVPEVQFDVEVDCEPPCLPLVVQKLKACAKSDSERITFKLADASEAVELTAVWVRFLQKNRLVQVLRLEWPQRRAVSRRARRPDRPKASSHDGGDSS